MATVAQRQADANARSDRRAGKYRALEFWRRWTTREGGRWCLMPLDRQVRVTGTADGAAHVSGIRRCASTWACPVCTPTIRERRAAEIDQGVSAHLAAGGHAYLVTATLQHGLGDDLASLLTMAQTAWSQTWKISTAVRRNVGYVGQIRAWDFTHGRAGWHPHIHAIILTECEGSASWLWSMADRWASKVADGGGYSDVTSARSPGWDVRPINDTAGMAEYLCKVEGGWGAGLEVARADIKRGSRSGSTPAELMAAAVDGDIDARVLMTTFELATAGRRAVVWGRGLKARLGVDDVDDESAVAIAPAGAVTVECLVPARAWRRLLWTGEASALVSAVGVLAAGLDPAGAGWCWPRKWLLAWRQSSALPIAA